MYVLNFVQAVLLVQKQDLRWLLKLYVLTVPWTQFSYPDLETIMATY